LTWLRQKASSLEARLTRRPSRSRGPRLALVTCYLSPLYFQVKGESHASVCGSRSHALIPTGARSRPAALPKPIIISAPKPHCWKGSASKPYVELPPHTAPLGIGMEVRPVPACAVKVVVHDFIKKERIGSWRLLACLPSDPAFSLLDISKRGLRSAPRGKIHLLPRQDSRKTE
jgi:hypothetical protein